MRISDWSSDVCSSDLLKGVELVRLVVAIPVFLGATVPDHVAGVVRQPCSPVDLAQRLCRVSRDIGTGIVAERRSAADHTDHMVETLRSEARRVGKEFGSTCKSRWSPYNYKKKHK